MPDKLKNSGWGDNESTVFDYLTFKFDMGAGAQPREARLLPRLTFYNADQAVLSFIPETVRKGTIKIGLRRVRAILGHNGIVTGRFDRPHLSLQLRIRGFYEDRPLAEGDEETLGGLRQIDGVYYTFSASPRGDELTVEPYRGNFGTLTVGPGKRKLDAKDVAITYGTVRTSSFNVTLTPQDATPNAVDQRLPEGDYQVRYMQVRYGLLSVSLGANSADPAPGQNAFPLKVRKDQPCVIDFAGPAEMVISSPEKDATIARGGTVSMSAALIDRSLNMAIRGLDKRVPAAAATAPADAQARASIDTSGTVAYKSVSLEPTVSITNAAGKEVFTGKMPFG